MGNKGAFFATPGASKLARLARMHSATGGKRDASARTGARVPLAFDQSYERRDFCAQRGTSSQLDNGR